MPEQPSSDRRRIVVFDVNETLLDIEALALLLSVCSGTGGRYASGSRS